MKEFIDKLISRLEEINHTDYGSIGSYESHVAVRDCLRDVKNIVNQLAEEYKHCDLCYLGSPCDHQNENAILPISELADENGWIPCEIELPPQPKENPLFDNKPLELYLATAKGSEYPWRVFWNGKSFTDGWSEVDVLAWMELPKPYQPKGE